MANAGLIALVAVPVIGATGVGAWWYFKADRVVETGETGGYNWRVRRVAGKFVPEVQPPAMPGFARGDFAIVPPITQTWENQTAAKSIALAHIATQLITPPGEQPEPASVSTSSFQQAPAPELELQAVTLEAVPATVEASAVVPTVAFVSGV